MLCFVPVLQGCVWYVCCYVRKKDSVFTITERRDMSLYEVPLSVSLLGFGIGTMLANSMCEVLCLNASPRGPMCFRCLIFNLSGPCELLFLLFFIASWI